MKISWLGHACFLVETTKRILTDPFDQQLGYPKLRVAVDLITISHQHFDHNAVGAVPGKPQVIQNTGEHSFNGIKIMGFRSFHDKAKGAQRGENIIFLIEAEGLRICHLGDLGHILDQALLKEIGKVDVLLVPVGGFYTINAEEAVKVVNQINPYYVVPMHYKTRYIDFPIASVEEFLKFYPSYVKQNELEVYSGKMPEMVQVVLLELTSV